VQFFWLLLLLWPLLNTIPFQPLTLVPTAAIATIGVVAAMVGDYGCKDDGINMDSKDCLGCSTNFVVFKTSNTSSLIVYLAFDIIIIIFFFFFFCDGKTPVLIFVILDSV